MISLLASAALLLNPAAFDTDQVIEPYKSIEETLKSEFALSQRERDRLFREAQFAAQKSMRALERSNIYFKRIRNIKVRDICTNAVVSGIASFAGAGSKEKVVIIVLGIVCGHANNACNNFWDGYDELQSSKLYAEHCDRCQERLWRDE